MLLYLVTRAPIGKQNHATNNKTLGLQTANDMLALKQTICTFQCEFFMYVVSSSIWLRSIAHIFSGSVLLRQFANTVVFLFLASLEFPSWARMAKVTHWSTLATFRTVDPSARLTKSLTMVRRASAW